jgi:hypothetical protein
VSSKIKNVALVILLGFFVIYFIYEAQDLLYGLSARILYPPDGALVTNSVIQVEGQVKGAAFINLNGRKIYADERGNFKEEFILADGLNILELTAQDRFGKVVKDTHSVVLK